jgi:hypothetical protein
LRAARREIDALLDALPDGQDEDGAR